MNPPALPVYRWTRKKYEHVAQEGGFGPDDRIELLECLLVLREPQGDRHAAAVSALQIALARAFGRRFHVRTGAPVALDPASEPEPDLAVVPGKRPTASTKGPLCSRRTDRLRSSGGLSAPGRDASWPYGWKYARVRVASLLP